MLRPAGSDPGGVYGAGGGDYQAVRGGPGGRTRGDDPGFGAEDDPGQRGAGERDDGPCAGLRRLRRLRPSDGGHLSGPAGPGRGRGGDRAGPAGSLRRRLRGGPGAAARHQVQADAERLPQHAGHRPAGRGGGVRQAAEAGRKADRSRAGGRRVDGRRANPQLRDHDQTAARGHGVPGRGDGGATGATGP